MRYMMLVIIGLMLFVACAAEKQFTEEVDRGYLTVPILSPTHDLVDEVERGYPESWTPPPSPTIHLSDAVDQGYLATAPVPFTPGPSATPIDPNTLPDLLITYIGFDWAVDHSCGVEVTVTVRNHGNAPAGAFVLLVDDQELTIDGLGAKQQQTHQFSVETGYLIPFYVDYYDEVVESNERNNNGIEALPYSDAIPGFVPCPHRTTPAPTPTIQIMPT